MEDALGVLCSYSFLKGNDEQDLYDMHRLVHIATRIWLRDSDSENQEEMKLREERVTLNILNIFSQRNFDLSVNYATYRLYLPHAIQLLQSRASTDSFRRYILCCRAALCLRTDGRFQEAIFWAQEAYHWFRKCRAEDDVHRLWSQCVLADIYAHKWQFPKAIELLQDNINIRKKFGKHDVELKYPRTILAQVYRLSGDTRKAIELQEVVHAGRAEPPREDLNRIGSQIALARAYLDDGQTEAAISLLEDALDSLKQSPENVVDRLSTLSLLVEAYHADGQTVRARRVFDELTGITESLPENYPRRAMFMQIADV